MFRPFHFLGRVPPPQLRLSPRTPSIKPIHPTATEAMEDDEGNCEEGEEEEEEQSFLDPLKMDAGSTPFRRKQKIPFCKKNGSSKGWVKIKVFKRELIF